MWSFVMYSFWKHSKLCMPLLIAYHWALKIQNGIENMIVFSIKRSISDENFDLHNNTAGIKELFLYCKCSTFIV